MSAFTVFLVTAFMALALPWLLVLNLSITMALEGNSRPTGNELAALAIVDMYVGVSVVYITLATVDSLIAKSILVTLCLYFWIMGGIGFYLVHLRKFSYISRRDARIVQRMREVVLDCHLIALILAAVLLANTIVTGLELLPT